MKNSAKNRIIIWSIVSGILIVSLVLSIIIIDNSYNCHYVTAGEEDYENNIAFNELVSANSAEFNVNGGDEVSIYWLQGDVIVNSTTDKKMTLKSYGTSTNDTSEDTQMYYHQGDIINVYSSKRAFELTDMFDGSIEQILGNYEKKDKTLVVNIPNTVSLSHLCICTGSANIELNDLDLSSLHLSTASGKTNLNNSDLANIEYSSVSGNINISSSTASTVYLNSVSGEVNARGIFSTLSANSVSGDVNVTFDNNQTDFVNIDTVSADATLKFTEGSGFLIYKESISGKLKNEFENTKVNDDYYEYGNGRTEVSFNSVSGNLNIKENKITDNTVPTTTNDPNSTAPTAPSATASTKSPTASSAPTSPKETKPNR